MNLREIQRVFCEVRYWIFKYNLDEFEDSKVKEFNPHKLNSGFEGSDERLVEFWIHYIHFQNKFYVVSRYTWRKQTASDMYIFY
jgi:hypothetical protein